MKTKWQVIVNCLSYQHFLIGNLCLSFPFLRRKTKVGQLRPAQQQMFQYFILFEMAQIVTEFLSSSFSFRLSKSEDLRWCFQNISTAIEFTFYHIKLFFLMTNAYVNQTNKLKLASIVHDSVLNIPQIMWTCNIFGWCFKDLQVVFNL